jgi:hypothetical protein
MANEWSKDDIKELISFCKENNVSQFSWSTYCFEFKLGNKVHHIETTPESKLTLEEIEKKRQQDYHELMFMSSK